MTKKEFVDALVLLTKLDRDDVIKVYNETFKLLAEKMAEEPVKIDNFGTFKIHSVGPTERRNPSTGEVVIVPKKNKVTFRPAKALKETIQ